MFVWLCAGHWRPSCPRECQRRNEEASTVRIVWCPITPALAVYWQPRRELCVMMNPNATDFLFWLRVMLCCQLRLQRDQVENVTMSGFALRWDFTCAFNWHWDGAPMWANDIISPDYTARLRWTFWHMYIGTYMFVTMMTVELPFYCVCHGLSRFKWPVQHINREVLQTKAY